IADSIESITKAIDDGAAGITGVADSTKSLVGDMADITGRMDTNREIVNELKHQMEVFADF
ncbi:MAG: methyl-accepting chemotaxis protein, partial [Hespellia sp.]|nr:methyl-accepting chemotaxis protein [Hespellia sp.]